MKKDEKEYHNDRETETRETKKSRKQTHTQSIVQITVNNAKLPKKNYP